MILVAGRETCGVELALRGREPDDRAGLARKLPAGDRRARVVAELAEGLRYA